MFVNELTTLENFTLQTKIENLDQTIEAVYMGDLLSWVMGKAPEGCAWITIQGHNNIVAVALLVGVSCIIVAEESEVSTDTIQKAEQEEIPIFTTKLTQYEVAKLFVEKGI